MQQCRPGRVVDEWRFGLSSRVSLISLLKQKSTFINHHEALFDRTRPVKPQFNSITILLKRLSACNDLAGECEWGLVIHHTMHFESWKPFQQKSDITAEQLGQLCSVEGDGCMFEICSRFTSDGDGMAAAWLLKCVRTCFALFSFTEHWRTLGKYANHILCKGASTMRRAVGNNRHKSVFWYFTYR